MSTFIQFVHPVNAKRPALLQREVAYDTEAPASGCSAPEDDGLGCMRGFAVAMLLNVGFVLMIAAGWELWRLLR
jgi:hypothetical protein